MQLPDIRILRLEILGDQWNLFVKIEVRWELQQVFNTEKQLFSQDSLERQLDHKKILQVAFRLFGFSLFLIIYMHWSPSGAPVVPFFSISWFPTNTKCFTALYKFFHFLNISLLLDLFHVV